MITVFTPTYNRGYIIGNLYESLCRQTNPDFEWVVVDDGSTDNTRELIQGFMDEGKIKLRYFHQQNSGKHIAINKGVEMAQGELFFIVDSDDYLTNKAIDTLSALYQQIENDSRFAGVSGIRISPDGSRIGGELPFDTLDCSIIDFSCKYGFCGDMAEAYKTHILKEYPFPFIDGEKFCPESLVWNRIARKYKLRYANVGFYVCEYRPDGLTASITRVRMKSPQSAMLFYRELKAMDISPMLKIRAAINYGRFAACSSIPFTKKMKQIGIIWAPFSCIGYFFHILDLIKQK